MRWRGRRASTNIEDRRGMGTGAKIGGGGLVIAIVALLFGADLGTVSSLLGLSSGGAPAESGGPIPEDDPAAQFIAVVLADTEQTWATLFEQRGEQYREPRLVIFDDAVASACGTQSSAVGPFYCPLDQRAYLDLNFFRELARRYGAPGDFAQAYVVAHEIGHHVQNLLGTSTRVHEQRRRLDQTAGNALSVKLELQADCYAGVWAHHADSQRAMLEQGDVEEGLAAAAAIGDDTLQRRAGGRVAPESWTHGSSAQRVKWFKRGMQAGTIEACDTFGG